MKEEKCDANVQRSWSNLLLL